MATNKKASKSKKSSSSGAKTAVPLQPLADRVVVRPLTDEERGMKTASGIIIPDTAAEKASEGTVVAVGPGRYDDGVLIPMAVSIHDRVVFGKYGHEEVKVGGEKYYIVRESDILAIISK